jgi:hypothetical protein
MRGLGAPIVREPMTTAKTGSGVEYDPRALDAIELRFWRELWDSVPAAVAAEHGVELATIGRVQANTVRELGEVPMLNLLLGATEPGAVADGDLDAAIAWARERGVRATVPLTPGLSSSEDAAAALRAAGMEPGYGWMKFVRDAHLPRFSPPDDVEVVELTDPDAEPFGAIVAAGFGLPAWCADFFAALPGRPGWRCYVARVDGAAFATGATFLDGGIAELGIGATLATARLPARPAPPPHHRRRRRRHPPALRRDRRAGRGPAGRQLPEHPPRRLRAGLPLPQLGGESRQTDRLADILP